MRSPGSQPPPSAPAAASASACNAPEARQTARRVLRRGPPTGHSVRRSRRRGWASGRSSRVLGLAGVGRGRCEACRADMRPAKNSDDAAARPARIARCPPAPRPVPVACWSIIGAAISRGCRRGGRSTSPAAVRRSNRRGRAAAYVEASTISLEAAAEIGDAVEHAGSALSSAAGLISGGERGQFAELGFRRMSLRRPRRRSSQQHAQFVGLAHCLAEARDESAAIMMKRMRPGRLAAYRLAHRRG